MRILKLLLSLTMGLPLPIFAGEPVKPTNHLQMRVDAMNKILAKLETSKRFFEVLSQIESPDKKSYAYIAQNAPNVTLPRIALRGESLQITFSDKAFVFESNDKETKLNGKKLPSDIKNLDVLLYQLSQNQKNAANSRLIESVASLYFGSAAQAQSCSMSSSTDCFFNVGGRSGSSRLQSSQNDLIKGLLGVLVGATVVTTGVLLGGTVGIPLIILGGAVTLLSLAVTTAKADVMPKGLKCLEKGHFKVPASNGDMIEVTSADSPKPIVKLNGHELPGIDVRVVQQANKICENAKGSEVDKVANDLSSADNSATKEQTNPIVR